MENMKKYLGNMRECEDILVLSTTSFKINVSHYYTFQTSSGGQGSCCFLLHLKNHNTKNDKKDTLILLHHDDYKTKLAVLFWDFSHLDKGNIFIGQTKQ